MVCYNLYVFNREGTCLYYREWYRPKSVKHGAGSLDDDQKQLFGLFWTLKNFTATLNPRDQQKPKLGVPLKIGEGCIFYCFRTNVYKLHFLESPSGVKVILNTTPDAGDLRDVLEHIYSQVLVEHVIKNPLYVPGEPFNFQQFSAVLDHYMKSRGMIQ